MTGAPRLGLTRRAPPARPSCAWSRDRPSTAAAVVVDRLVVGDGEQPGVEVAGVRQSVVGAERRDERVLENVLGVVRADRGDEVSEHVGRVLLEHLLERWKRFT